MRRSVGSISGCLGLVERGHRVERRERGLAARVGVEGRDADEAVHPALAREQAERVPALDRERRGAEPGFGARRHLVDLGGETAPFRPAQVHAQQHVGPVLRVGAARAGVDRADRVAVVVLTGEQRAQLQRVELTAERFEPGADLALDRLVALLAGKLGERLEIRNRAVELIDEGDVLLELRELGVDLAGAILVVPEVGLADLDLELLDPGPRLVDLQVGARALDAAAQFGQVVGEVTHGEVGRSAAVAELVLLAAPTEARFVAAGRLLDLHRHRRLRLGACRFGRAGRARRRSRR